MDVEEGEDPSHQVVLVALEVLGELSLWVMWDFLGAIIKHGPFYWEFTRLFLIVCK